MGSFIQIHQPSIHPLPIEAITLSFNKKTYQLHLLPDLSKPQTDY
jgi:hypothetical protein